MSAPARPASVHFGIAPARAEDFEILLRRLTMAGVRVYRARKVRGPRRRAAKRRAAGRYRRAWKAMDSFLTVGLEVSPSAVPFGLEGVGATVRSVRAREAARSLLPRVAP